MIRKSWLITLIGAAALIAAIGLATRSSALDQQDKFAVANENVKQLLLLMDTDNSGRISKQEWMHFMEAEFDKLDTDKNGELDPKELMQSKLAAKKSCPVVVKK